jgi:hypothetical protein
MTMDRIMRREIEMAAEEVQQTITELESAVDAVLARLPPDRLVRLGLLTARPEVIEDRYGIHTGDWLDAIGPLVGRRLLEVHQSPAGQSIRTRALLQGVIDAIAP